MTVQPSASLSIEQICPHPEAYARGECCGVCAPNLEDLAGRLESGLYDYENPLPLLDEAASAIDLLAAALRDIASHDLIALTGPARIVAEAMRDTARTALAKAGRRS